MGKPVKPNNKKKATKPLEDYDHLDNIDVIYH